MFTVLVLSASLSAPPAQAPKPPAVVIVCPCTGAADCTCAPGTCKCPKCGPKPTAPKAGTCAGGSCAGGSCAKSAPRGWRPGGLVRRIFHRR